MRYILMALILGGCVTRQQIEAELWLHDKIPEHLCTADLSTLGIYRVLPCKPEIPSCADGQKVYDEVLPYCSPRVETFLAADQEKVAEWLKELRKPKP